MFKFLREKFTSIVGDEAERQNAVARFGTGIPIDRNGMVSDPRDDTKKMHVDDFGKLSADDRMKAIVPAVNRLAEVKQIRPEDIGPKEGRELLGSSFKSMDNIGRQMKGDETAAPSAIAQKATSLNEGPLMSMLRGSSQDNAPAPKNTMRPS